MKKVIVFVAAAAALVACSKSEVTPALNSADTEISYLVAPKTKAEASRTFLTTWTFKSTAFYLDNSKTWASNASDSQKYIDDVEISWNGTDNVWRNADRKYYWPKNGKLTFCSYTSLKETTACDTTSTGDSKASGYADAVAKYGVVTEANTNDGATPTANNTYVKASVGNNTGVQYKDFDITANKNIDLLVADIKADQTKNNQDVTNAPMYNTDGVPTLFRHKLSKVLFTAKLAQNYKDDGISFRINSITFPGIDSEGTYVQLDAEGWTNSGTALQTYYDDGVAKTSSTTGFEVLKDAREVLSKDSQYLYLPQSFEVDQTTKDCFVVDYNIYYANNSTENIKATFSLNNSDSSKNIFDKWEMGKRYTINLTFSLNEILWDPAVEDWADVTKDITVGE